MLLFCFSMVQSGSALQYNLARELVSRAGIGAGEGYLMSHEIDVSINTLESWGRDSAYHVVKLYEPHRQVARLVDEGHAKVCCAFRDIRDVAVSARREGALGDDALMASLQRAVDAFYVISTYDGVLFQRYEDLVGTADRSTDEIDAYLGLDSPPDVREGVAAQERSQALISPGKTGHVHPFTVLCERSLDHLAKSAFWAILAQLGFSSGPLVEMRSRVRDAMLSQYASSAHNGPSGITRGTSLGEAWREALSAKDIQKIESRFGMWLRDVGYVGSSDNGARAPYSVADAA